MSAESPVVRGIEVLQFSSEAKEVAPDPVNAIPTYKAGSSMPWTAWAMRIHTDAGITGDYVGGMATEYSTIGQIAHMLIGRRALERELFYWDAKNALRQAARLGLGVTDIALWDLMGKLLGRPIWELLGGKPDPLPAYASTLCGDREEGGLNSPEAYADFAERCLDLGYKAFKIHPWAVAPIEEHLAVVRAVGERVGGKMDLMLDPFCAYRTFGDAVKVGRACDDYGYFWWEDPFRDGGVSQFAHKKLRQLVRTPLLQLEHVRGLEAHVDFVVAEATDFVRADPDWDGGITGVMKIAHAAEGFGLDVEVHSPGPVRRHLMAAIENTNYYELSLVHPVAENFLDIHPGFGDQLDDIDEDGCVNVPTGPGLGVDYDWEMIYSTGARTTYGHCD